MSKIVGSLNYHIALYEEGLIRKVAKEIADKNYCIQCIACSCEDGCESEGFAELFIKELAKAANDTPQ